MNYIKKIRQIKRINQKTLADAAQISQPYLHDLENNHRGAKPETLVRIADALGVTVNDLRDDQEETA